MSAPEFRRVPELDSYVSTLPATRAQVNFLARLAMNRISDDKFDVRTEDSEPYSELYRGEDSFGGTRLSISLVEGIRSQHPDIRLGVDTYFPGEPGSTRLIRHTDCWLQCQGILWSKKYDCLRLHDTYQSLNGLEVGPLFGGPEPDFDRIDTNGFDNWERIRQMAELWQMWSNRELLTRSRCSELTRNVAAFDPRRAQAYSDIE